MSGWRDVTLGDVCELKRGYDLPNGSRKDGRIPVVSSSGPTGWHDEAKVSAPGVVTGRYGTLGQVFYLAEDFWPLNTSLYVRDFKGNDPRFVAVLLRSLDLARYDGAAAVPGLNRNHLHTLPVRVPDLPVQSVIAQVNRVFDDLIENNRRRVEVLEEMARAIYREWFVKFRYPGHEDVPLVDSALGPMPEGWEHRRLFDAADVGFGYSFKSPRFSAQGPNQVIRIRDIPAGISSTFTDEVVIPRYAVSDDDVLVGMDGDFHMTVWTGGDAWLNQRVTRLRSLAGMSNLQLLLSVENQIVTWNKSIVGTTVAHLGKKHLELVTVLVSDGSTLERANAVFQPIMEQRRSLIQASRRLEALRDHLLPKLVTGQIDLSALDLDVLLVEQVA